MLLDLCTAAAARLACGKRSGVIVGIRGAVQASKLGDKPPHMLSSRQLQP
jgi:hypothetical protein